MVLHALRTAMDSVWLSNFYFHGSFSFVLKVTLDCSLSMHQQMTNACTTFYNERRLIGSIRQYLTVDATKTHISGFLFLFFLLSRPDCCNPLLSGAPQYLLDRLKRVANAPVRLTVKASKSDDIIPILDSLHWLPVSAKIQYNIFSLCYSSLSDSGPEYLS